MMGLVLIHVPFLISLILLSNNGIHPDELLVTSLVGAAAFLSIGLRRHYPTIFLSLVLAAIIVQVVLLSFPTVSWLIVLVAMFDVARWMPLRHRGYRRRRRRTRCRRNSCRRSPSRRSPGVWRWALEASE